MKIAICDDEILAAKQLQRMLNQILLREDLPCESVIYTSGKELLADIMSYGAVFLDLKMPQLDGFEVGKQILKKNPRCRIIIATGEWERYKEGYYLRAIRFVTKPFVENELAEALQAALETYPGEDVVEVYDEGIKYQIQQKRIYSIRAFNGYIHIYTSNHQYRKDISLEEIERQLDGRLFVRVDRGKIINLAHVETYRITELTIAGEKVRVARRRRETVRETYINFDVKYRGIMEV